MSVAEVYIDGHFCGEFSNHASRDFNTAIQLAGKAYKQPLFTIKGLDEGKKYTLRLVVTNGEIGFAGFVTKEVITSHKQTGKTNGGMVAGVIMGLLAGVGIAVAVGVVLVKKDVEIDKEPSNVQNLECLLNCDL